MLIGLTAVTSSSSILLVGFYGILSMILHQIVVAAVVAQVLCI